MSSDASYRCQTEVSDAGSPVLADQDVCLDKKVRSTRA